MSRFDFICTRVIAFRIVERCRVRLRTTKDRAQAHPTSHFTLYVELNSGKYGCPESKPCFS